MILVDTSIWVHHLRRGLPGLMGLLQQGRVLGHPWVTGEIALGSLSQRQHVLGLLSGLPQAKIATPSELGTFLEHHEHHELYGSEIGYVDLQLLAATRLTVDARLWTGDRRLAAAAARLDLLADQFPAGH